MSKREYFEYNGVTYDVTFGTEFTRHGGPFDRGGADSYYHRGMRPHYYVGATSMSDRIEEDGMTKEQINEYCAGYEHNEMHGAKKEW